MKHKCEAGYVSLVRDKWERVVFKVTGQWPQSKVDRRLAWTDRDTL